MWPGPQPDRSLSAAEMMVDLALVRWDTDPDFAMAGFRIAEHLSRQVLSDDM